MMHVGIASRALTAGLLVLLVLPGAHGQAPNSTVPTTRAAFANVKLHFERNDGQAAAHYRYVARGQGYDLRLGDSAVTMALRNGSNQAVVTMRPLGAQSALPAGDEQLVGKANYLTGRDPSRWLTNVPTYGRVAYRSIYPGIDLVYYGNQRRVQYDFIVSPGGDPGAIRVAYEGASRVGVSGNGDLVVHLRDGQLRQAKPYAYQMINGKQVAVPARFTVRGDRSVGFQIARYDTGRTLVIDPVVFPVLEYSTFLGGAGDDGAQGVAVDGAGNAYVASWTNSGNFPTTAGAFDTSINGGYDVAVTKISPDGKTVLYSTYLGGAGYDFASAIVLRGGNAVVVGDTDSTDFPVTVGAVQTTNAGGTDGFVTELNAAGNGLVASTYVGGGGYDTVRAIALDTANNRVCLTGWTQSSDFPTTAGAFQTAWPAGLPSSAFATALAANLSGYSYSSYLHGNAQEQYGTGVAVDALGRVAVVGRTNSVTFPTTVGAFQTTITGESDAFVALFNPTGAGLEWCTLYGGLWTDGAEAVAIDGAGNVCFVGRADSNDLPLRGAYQGANMGKKDAFFAAIEPGGAVLHWGTYLGGQLDDMAFTLTKDAAGFMYITGETWSADFPTTAGAFQTTRSGLSDAFVAKINPTGGGVLLLYSTYLGGSTKESATGAACDGDNVLLVSGWTSSADYPTTPGVVSAAYGGGPADGFVARFDLKKAPTTLYTIDRTGVYGENIFLRSYDLRRTFDNAMLPGETITFKIDGTAVGTAVTDAGGDASLLWTITAGPATRTITAEFAGTSEYLPSSANATLYSVVWATKMVGFDRTRRITDTTELKARLLRSDNVPVYNKAIDFYVDGSFVVTRWTNVSGYASWPVYVVPDGAGAGPRPIFSEWLGDIGYLPVSKTATLTVQPALPYIWVLSKSVPFGSAVSLYAYFRRLYDYLPQGNKPVTWKVDGTPIHSMNTNGGGVASFVYWTVESVGVHTLQCEWAGDAFVEAGTGNGTLTIL